MVDQYAFQATFPKRHTAVLGTEFSVLTRDELGEHILRDSVPKRDGARLVVTANLDHLSNLVRNARFRAAYANVWTATADGMPVYLYLCLRGISVPERITGADLFVDLMEKMRPGSCVPFFVASSVETGELLKQRLVERGFAPDCVAYACPAFGFEDDAAASKALAKAINEHGTTHLFFGLGAPKSEVWIHEHRALLGNTYALAVGASLDFYVGRRKRAPIWMRECGLEWAWRVLLEPKRLFRRYFIDSWFALWMLATDFFAFKRSAATYDCQSQQNQRL
jgi:N-acetylglucosaminyldiphosphoundecaprenol N-acetyl-beta-D-mannosaminyltransferase